MDKSGIVICNNIDLGLIPLNLKCNSRLYDVTDGEVYLGTLTHKALVKIGIDLAENSIKKNIILPGDKSEQCLILSKQWLEDLISLSEKDLDNARRNLDPDDDVSFMAWNVLTLALSPNYANPLRDIAFKARALACRNEPHHTAAISQTEAMNQGRFIIDFMKSSKHLFYV